MASRLNNITFTRDPRILHAVAAIGCAAALALSISLAQAAPSKAPRPLYTAPGYATALTASGWRIAFASGCEVRVADLSRAAKPRLLKRVGTCRRDRYDSDARPLLLGRKSLTEQIVQSPSPHGDTYQLWNGPTAGPLHQVGHDWRWTDSDVPAGYGCAWSAAAGGGVVAIERIPNTLALDAGLADKVTCPAGSSSTIILQGASKGQLKVAGSWEVIATDGKRVALAALDADGHRTGKVDLFDLSGKILSTPKIDPQVVQKSSDAWLTPQGLVLAWKKGIVAPRWKISGIGSYPQATVAEGRAFYVKGRTIRVRRLVGGPDRMLTRVPNYLAALAAGSFGLAIEAGTDNKTVIYRLPWRTIDRTLPR